MRKVIASAIVAMLFIPAALSWVMTGSLLLRPAYQSQATADVPVTVPIGPLKPGTMFRFDLPRSDAPYAAINLLMATWETVPVASWTVCVDGRCERTRSWVADNQSARLRLPPETRGGPVDVRLESVHFGLLAYWGTDAAHPRWTASRGGEWATALSGARKMAAAAGVRRPGLLLASDVLALLLCSALAVRMLLRGRSVEDVPAERSSLPSQP
jgi:hypothetical protein